MEPYDVEIGPTQETFNNLFKRIGEYFQSAPVAPEGTISETDLSVYSQEQLRKTLNKSLKFYGFTDLPSFVRVACEDDSEISGIQRSDEITTYDEKMKDGSHRTFNFYTINGPENMQASYYWSDAKKNGEQTRGILTEEDRWYLQVKTSENDVYYIRIEREIPHW